MQPFQSAIEMRDAHAAMFGSAGRFAAETVLDLAPRLFAVPLDPLSYRVVFAPDEMGGYNRHAGFYYGDSAGENYILANRHYCEFRNHQIVVRNERAFVDFIVHELCHARQTVLLREHRGERGWSQPSKEAHRDRGWYAACAEASQSYLGHALPETMWPKRDNAATLSNPEMTHFPGTIRKLFDASDPRLVAAQALAEAE